MVLAEEVTVLLMMLLPNTAATLTVQLLPGAMEEVMVCSVNDPLTVSVCCTDDEPHLN